MIRLQCRLRRFVAMEELKKLRAAAKDLGLLEQSNEALKAESIELLLRARAAEDAKRSEERASAAKDAEIARVVAELTELKDSFQKEYKQRLLLDTRLATSESMLAQVKAKLSAAEDKNVVLTETLAKTESDLQQAQQTAEEAVLRWQDLDEAYQYAQQTADDATHRLQQTEEALGNAQRNTNEAISRAVAAALAAAGIHHNSTVDAVSMSSAPTAVPMSAPSATLPLTLTAANIASISGGGSAGSSGDLAADLTAERNRRIALEEEVERLRSMSVELRTQVEVMRKGGVSASATAAPSISIAPSTVTRRPDVEPRRKSRGSITGQYQSQGSFAESDSGSQSAQFWRRVFCWSRSTSTPSLHLFFYLCRRLLSTP